MRIVVVGATGNVGTSLVPLLAGDERVEFVVGVARRLPRLEFPKVAWAQADVARDDLVPLFRGADCVVHLAWLIQPSRDLNALWRTNVEGSTRVFAAAREAGVRAVLYASSIGTYSPGPKDRKVDESWPRDGIATNYYSRQKAEVERRLDRFEREEPSLRVVRLRPSFIYKREAASGQRRLFAGPFVPAPLLRRSLVPIFPHVPGLRFQAVHTSDIAQAYRLAALGDAHGAFNVAADDVLDTLLFARELRARAITVPPRIVRAFTALAWRARVVPIDEGWFDAGMQAPLLDSTRARRELGWEPRLTSLQAIREFARGLRDRSGIDTPPLRPGYLADELKTRVGATDR